MPGTIVIRTNERALYYFVGVGQAIRYPVGVGRLGMQWSGTAFIDGKYIRPAWSPPDSIRKDYSRLPPVIPGGSPKNPMGVAAMTLSGGGQYAIHGTNNEGSIGELRVARLHPHAQRGHRRSLQPGHGRHARRGDR